MNKFPVEILKYIFNFLHQTEKVECMLVCRHWASTIFTSCLFNTVTILSKQYNPDAPFARFKSLTKSLEKNQFLGKQVQHLLLRDCFDFEFDGSTLGSQFPHVRFLFLSNTYIGQNRFTPVQLERFKPWQNYLQKIIEHETALFTFSLLDAGVFHYLKTIFLSPDRESIPAPIEEQHFKSLKNAPLLTTLKLSGLSFPLEYLELIHENAPSLKYLALRSIFIEEEVNLPESISPTSCMETLCIQSCTLSLDIQHRWMKYITQKYTGLTGLTFECDMDSMYAYDNRDYSHYLTTPLTRSLGHQLKLLHIESVCLSPEILEVIDSNGYELQDIKLSRIGTPFLLQTLFRSNQVEYIQSLTLTYLIDFQNFNLLRDLTVLKSLSLDFECTLGLFVDNIHRFPLRFDKLLKQCPGSLEELTISNMHIQVKHTQDRPSNQIKSLNFTRAKIDDGVTQFIASNCSQLSSISLIRCATPVLDFWLQNHDLKYFEIAGHFVSSAFILTRAGNTLYFAIPEDVDPIKYYCESFINQDARPFYNLYKPVSQDEVNLKLRIQLTCRNVHSLFINGRLIL